MSCGYITSGCTVDLIALGFASSAGIIDIKHHERCLKHVVCAIVVCCVATRFTWTEYEALPVKKSNHGLVDFPCQKMVSY